MPAGAGGAAPQDHRDGNVLTGDEPVSVQLHQLGRPVAAPSHRLVVTRVLAEHGWGGWTMSASTVPSCSCSSTRVGAPNLVTISVSTRPN